METERRVIVVQPDVDDPPAGTYQVLTTAIRRVISAPDGVYNEVCAESFGRFFEGFARTSSAELVGGVGPEDRAPARGGASWGSTTKTSGAPSRTAACRHIRPMVPRSDDHRVLHQPVAGQSPAAPRGRRSPGVRQGLPRARPRLRAAGRRSIQPGRVCTWRILRGNGCR